MSILQLSDGQNACKGQVVQMPLHPSERQSHLLPWLPRQGCMLAVTQLSPGEAPDDVGHNLRHQWVVDMDTVHAALRYLVQHNPKYKEFAEKGKVLGERSMRKAVFEFNCKTSQERERQLFAHRRQLAAERQRRLDKERAHWSKKKEAGNPADEADDAAAPPNRSWVSSSSHHRHGRHRGSTGLGAVAVVDIAREPSRHLPERHMPAAPGQPAKEW